MTQRTRKLIGTVALAVFIVIYALVAVSLTAARPPVSSCWLSLAFYVIAGLLWVLPAGLIITWMQRPR